MARIDWVIDGGRRAERALVRRLLTMSAEALLRDLPPELMLLGDDSRARLVELIENRRGPAERFLAKLGAVIDGWISRRGR